MKKFSLLLFAFILFSCSGSDDESQYPTITVVNAAIEGGKKIRSISLVGYEFTGLNIEQGQSVTYKLMDGISSSPSPLTVTFFCGDRNWTVTNSTVELVNGQTTTVTLKHKSCDGSISAGYCRASCLE
tara:strand:- start:70 stop:453 length:384 start_codon:yes stop_codon:yes gene_type:complete